MQLAVTSRSMQDDGKIRLSAGEFTPDWDNSVASAKNDLMCYDVPIDCEHTYNAVWLSTETGTPTLEAVDVYQKLVLVKNRVTGKLGQFLLTLVPEIAYERQHQGEVAELFINAGDKGGFTGVAIYSIPGLDLIVRANRYTNGIKDWGVHMSGNIKDLNEKVFWLKSILRPFKLLRCPDIQSRGMGEDIIIEWIKSGKTVVKSGNDWLFTDLDGSQFIMMDSDKDGEPDTIVIGPENGGGENTEPTPDPDPEDGNDLPKRCERCGLIGCNGNCVTPGGGGSGGDKGNNENTILKNVKLKFDVSKYPGYVSGVRDCKGVSNELMKDFLGVDGNIEIERIQLYKEEGGKLQLVHPDAAKIVFDELNRHLDAGRPMIVGVDHTPGTTYNTDHTTDHFVVVYARGYDEEKKQYYYNYIETGRYKESASKAYEDKWRLYYNPNDKSFKGKSYRDKKNYQIVQIRTNF